MTPEPAGPIAAVVVTGVSGSGKTTVGARLAQRLGWRFVDGDDLHPPANRAKMRDGLPLTDADRWPWLATVAHLLDHADPEVVACSALRRRYRDFLRGDRPGVRFVHLAADRALIGERLARRTGHFFPAGLADSQFATLEEPAPDEDALIVDAGQPPDTIVAEITAWLTQPSDR